MASDEVETKPTCMVRDGRFVVPCDGLASIIQGPAAFSRGKGIRQWDLFKRDSGPSRSFVGAKSDAHPNGLLFNYCPICGVDISAPFNTEPSDAHS